MAAPFLQRLQILPERIRTPNEHPFNVPAIQELDVPFTTPVTFFVGENGSGKSTVLEAIAALSGLPVAGGSRSDIQAGHAPEDDSALSLALRPSFKSRPRDGYFLRAEFHAHFASLLDVRRADPEFVSNPYALYGGKSLHQRSHGEAFLAILEHRVRDGLYLFDEPESALSPQRQLALLAHMYRLAGSGRTQFIVATHSPILLTFPGAVILSFDGSVIARVTLEETSHFQITRRILDAPEAYWRHLRDESGDDSDDGLSG